VSCCCLKVHLLIMRWLQATRGRLENVFAYRWNEAEPTCILQLVFVWVTTGRLGPKACKLISERPGLMLVGTQATGRLCPLLDLLPQFYTGTSHSRNAMDDVSLPATVRKPSRLAKAPPKAVFRMDHGLRAKDIRSNQLPACKAARLNPGRRRLYKAARIGPVVNFGCCHSFFC
jgi:hypothetical protein